MTGVDRGLLAQPFPDSEISWREGAYGRKLAYLRTAAVIRRLNEAAPSWDFRLVRIEWRDDLLIAVGELSIPGMGTRTGIGVQRVDPKSDDVIKGVASDALKKAATLFGVGLDLYDTDAPADGEHPAPAVKRGTDPLTDRQRSFILALAKDLGWVNANGEVDSQALDGALLDLAGFPLAELTREDASRAIEHLKALVQQQRDRPAQADLPSTLDVSWTAVWQELRALGIKHKDEAIDVLGGWSNDPREVRRMIRAARARMP